MVKTNAILFIFTIKIFAMPLTYKNIFVVEIALFS